MPLEVGDQVGRIIGAEPGTTVMHQNVAVAEAIVLSCFRPVDPRRNRIVYEAGNFPSVRYLYQAQQELEVVVCDDDAAIIDAIDERTLLVPISHVLFKSGEIQDVEAITRRAHEVGARVVLDCYQSAGIVPVQRRRARGRLRGRRLGQVALRRPRERLALRAAGPDRGARADVHGVAGAREPVRVRAGAALRARRRALSDGHAERARRSTRPRPATTSSRRSASSGSARTRSLQTDLLIRLADEAGFEVRSPRDPARRGGTVTVHVPDFEAVHKELAERQVLCDFRPGAGHSARPALLQHERRARAGRRD